MDRQLEKPASPAAAAAIDHYSDWCVYGLVAAGFATLAGTGGLDWLTLGAMFSALSLRGYLLWTGRAVTISQSLTTLLTIGYFIFFAADYFAISRGFLPATVHLAVFAVIIRMFSLRRLRDNITLAILAFLMILAAAILTVDTLFLFSFSVFLLIAVATFVLFEMQYSFGNSQPQARDSVMGQDLRDFPVSIARVALGLMLMILAGSALLFLILPRRSAGYLSAYSFGTDLSSGFSDHVRLGQIGRIQQSNAVVMHVQIEGDHTGRYDLYWRGVALAEFDGQVWSKPRQEFLLPRSTEDDSFVMPESETPKRWWSGNNVAPQVIHYRVLMEPIGTNVFFLAPKPQSVSGNYQLLAADSAGDVYDLDSQHPVSRYEAESDVSKPSARNLQEAGGDYPRDVTQTYLRLPPMDVRVRQLADQVTDAQQTAFDKATAVEKYLRTNYRYTLELPKTSPADPVANFLFDRKEGHCEYFASAMAVMLRSVGIPARVVNGFRSDEFNDLTGNYVVRAKDAHAWVEAFFPGYGWQTFDPTPSGGVGTPQGWSRVALYFDAMASLWREWVVSYDVSHQYMLGQTAIDETRSLWDRGRTWTRAGYESILRWGRQVHRRAERSPLEWIFAALAASAAFLMVRNWGGIGRLIRELRWQAHPERNPEQAATMWYRRMARTVARNGMRRPQSLTPQEFVETIQKTSLREPVARFTESYESARFGNCAEDAARLPELFEEVETAARRP